MKLFEDVRGRAALLISMLALGGCAVGSAYVSAPDRLPGKDLPTLTRAIRFDVCGYSLEGPDRSDEGDQVRKALWRAGVTAELTPVAGSPVDFTVTTGGDFDFGWSAMASTFTLSVLPGYAVDRKTLEVDLSWRDAAQVERTEHLRYEARTIVLIWLPLVVVPDFWYVVADGWSSAKLQDGGFKRLVLRLGDDLRARLSGDTAQSKVGAACPMRKPTRG